MTTFIIVGVVWALFGVALHHTMPELETWQAKATFCVLAGPVGIFIFAVEASATFLNWVDNEYIAKRYQEER